MPRPPIRQLEDWVVRLQQAEADGKSLMSITATKQILRTVIEALKEK